MQPVGHSKSVAAQRVSAIDTETPSIYGVFLDCMGLLRLKNTPPLDVQGWFHWTKERPLSELSLALSRVSELAIEPSRLLLLASSHPALFHP